MSDEFAESQKATFPFQIAIGDWGVFWGATPFGQANGVAKVIRGQIAAGYCPRNDKEKIPAFAGMTNVG